MKPKLTDEEQEGYKKTFEEELKVVTDKIDDLKDR